MIGSDPEGADLESRVASWSASAISDAAAAVSPAAVRSGKHGGQWKITQYMYQQIPEQSGGVAPASSESATRIRARPAPASACGRRARRGFGYPDIYLPVQGPGR